MRNARRAAGLQALVPSLHRQWRANEVHFGNRLSLTGPVRPTTARIPPAVARQSVRRGADNQRR